MTQQLRFSRRKQASTHLPCPTWQQNRLVLKTSEPWNSPNYSITSVLWAVLAHFTVLPGEAKVHSYWDFMLRVFCLWLILCCGWRGTEKMLKVLWTTYQEKKRQAFPIKAPFTIPFWLTGHSLLTACPGIWWQETPWRVGVLWPQVTPHSSWLECTDDNSVLQEPHQDNPEVTKITLKQRCPQHNKLLKR